MTEDPNGWDSPAAKSLKKEIAVLVAERNAAIDHMTELGVEACRERDARIAELEAEKNLYFTRMQEEFKRAEQAEDWKLKAKQALKEENERWRQAEAELAALKGELHLTQHQVEVVRSEAETELAALKGRRCETCANDDVCASEVVSYSGMLLACVVSCSAWAERGTK